MAVILLGLVLAAGACSDGEDASASGSAATSTTPTTSNTTTSTTTTSTTTTTTSTTTTTLSQEQQDAVSAAALWDGLTDAWAEGPEAAARYIADHSYPGWPAAYEDCLRPEAPVGSMVYTPDPESLEADPGWTSSELGIDVDGRIYTMDVEITRGVGVDAVTAVSSPHVTIVDGRAWFFFVCEPPLADDALAYRLAEGAEYAHRITYRADLTEDQRPAGGGRANGRETWTQERSFRVTGVSGDTAKIQMTVDRITWKLYSAGVTRNEFDTDDADWDEYDTGLYGDLAFEDFNWNVPPEGPGMNPDSALSFVELPAVAVEAGDTWTTPWRLDDPSLAGTLTVTVLSVTDDEVRVSLEGDVQGSRMYSHWGARYDLATAGTATGTARIDPATGWVRTMTIDVDAEGTIEFTGGGGLWMGIRPLAGSSQLAVGVEMPTTYSIRIETTTVGG